MSLKARVLLQLASPFYFDRAVNTLPVNQNTGNQQELYRSAKTAALAVINSGTYKLIDCRAATLEQTANNFHQSIIDKNNSEKIFTRQFAQKGINQLVGTATRTQWLPQLVGYNPVSRPCSCLRNGRRNIDDRIQQCG